MKTKFALIPAFFAAATFGTAFAQNVPQDPDADENRQDGKKATEDSTADAPNNDGTPRCSRKTALLSIWDSTASARSSSLGDTAS